jgi:hypothetical protein
MAELRLIMVNDKAIRTTKSPILVEGVAPHASPIISDPRFGSRNSDLEMVPNDFMVSNMALPTKCKGLENKKCALD